MRKQAYITLAAFIFRPVAITIRGGEEVLLYMYVLLEEGVRLIELIYIYIPLAADS